MALYAGDIVDAHQHFWNLSETHYPWLTSAEHSIKALGDIGDLRRNYLPADFIEDAAQQPVIASVCVEAGWDRSRPPSEEPAWHHSLQRPGMIGGRFVGWAPLRDPDAARILEELARFPALVGLRETVRWHPDPAKRWTEAGLLEHPDWLKGLRLLARHNLLLEVLMNPYQSEDVARLAGAHPHQQIVVNHCGTPVDRDAEGMARWRDGLARMGRHENVSIKLSNFAAYAADKSLAARKEIVLSCLDAFGPGRVMFASDFPVGRRNLSYASSCEAMRTILSGLSDDEQGAIFRDNAWKLYRFQD